MKKIFTIFFALMCMATYASADVWDTYDVSYDEDEYVVEQEDLDKFVAVATDLYKEKLEEVTDADIQKVLDATKEVYPGILDDRSEEALKKIKEVIKDALIDPYLEAQKEAEKALEAAMDAYSW